MIVTLWSQRADPRKSLACRGLPNACAAGRSAKAAQSRIIFTPASVFRGFRHLSATHQRSLMKWLALLPSANYRLDFGWWDKHFDDLLSCVPVSARVGLRIADQHPFWCVPGLDLLECQDVFHLLLRGFRLDFILRRNQWRVNRGRFGGQGVADLAGRKVPRRSREFLPWGTHKLFVPFRAYGSSHHRARNAAAQ